MFNPKILLLSVFFLLLLPVVSADIIVTTDDKGVYKQWNDVPVIRACFNNGTYCSQTSQCNLTVINPEGTVIVNNELMTNQFATHNLTVRGGFTGVLGDYQNIMTCNDAGLYGQDTFSFQITPNGQRGLLGFYFLMIGLVYGSLVLGIWKRDITVTMLATFGMFFVGIYILFFGLDIFKNLFTDGFAWLTIGIACYVSFRMGMDYINGE